MRWRSPHSPFLLLFISLLTVFVGRVTGFKICSYNVGKLTPKKAANQRVIYTITQVVSQCDICLLQNVIDPESKATKNLVHALSRRNDRYGKSSYATVSSGGLGNSTNDMQQYVFLYRKNTVNMTGHHQYESKGFFLRDPFVVKFQSNKTAIKDFILVPLHSNPNNVVKELNKLYDVYVEVTNKWKNTNVMFLGDFHADCGYLSRSDKKNIRLYTNRMFTWLVKDRVDTTVNSQMSCAYDRIVVSGKPFLKAIKPLSAQPFKLDSKIPKAMVLEVSNHMPVEVTLKSSAGLLQAASLLILLSVSAIVQSFLSAL
ncbi:deoxyribonuclease-1-like 1 [Anabas testudineus]|uniref:Deoxyribonuclease n=1 Tax=Anabas testudineus TaxID=64144 RepID=A0A3Q1JHX9_ANATE|nr:deoxyribonuclease-1-like 1 [Anabas testudineus]XP_026223331.1 deoxyribonuclease-1-like 1 [Anabas testudineus]XP_026223332.1 deoxyribonuclease-1-like 1 [Anabas testudineus]